MSNKDIYRLVIVDDSNFIRSNIAKHFHSEKQIICVKTFYSTKSLIDYLAIVNTMPDILLLDINLFGVSSLNSLPDIKRLAPEMKIVVYTMYEEPDFLIKALRLGVSGYLLKTNNLDEIENELIDFIKGGVKISPKMAHKLCLYLRKPNVNIDKGLDSLTIRERETLSLLSQGFEYGEIAEQLGISTNSIRTHIKGIYKKLQVNNSIQAVKRYIDSKDLFIDDEENRLKSNLQ